MTDEYRYGLVTWQRGERFRFRTWLGLRLLDSDIAAQYFWTTVDGADDRA